MTKKQIVASSMDLAMFSNHALALFNEWLAEEDHVTNRDVLSVGPGGRMLTIDRDGETLQVPINGDSAKYIVGYITLASVARRALSTLSWQFIEWLLETYGTAFNEGELKLGEVLTESFIYTNYDKNGAIGINREFITRWAQFGVVCKTDLVIRDEIRMLPKGDVNAVKININYPIIIVGQVIFFNQHFPAPCMIIRHKDGELGPRVANAIIYESLGLAEVEQIGPAVEFNYKGDVYEGDTLGVRLKQELLPK